MGDLAAVLDAHLAAEFVDHDIEGTMATMSDDPYLVHVPTLSGGRGREQVRRFYEHDWLPSWPDDVRTTPLSRTVGDDRVVDELIVSFTHDREMPFMLPGVAPTGRAVELPHAVVVGFEQAMVAWEHIYWDQASLLVQLDLLDPAPSRRAGC
jgi:carboxymethylenebutenolidase